MFWFVNEHIHCFERRLLMKSPLVYRRHLLHLPNQELLQSLLKLDCNPAVHWQEFHLM